MEIIILIGVLISVGALMWLMNTYVPMTRPVKTVLNIAVLIAVILGMLSACFISKWMEITIITLVLIAVGVLMWLMNTYVPMTRPIKTVLNIAVLIAVILGLLFACFVTKWKEFAKPADDVLFDMHPALYMTWKRK